MAACFLDKNVPTEHLMYVLEIEPPIDKNDENGGVTLMPACKVNKFNGFISIIHLQD